MRSRWPGSDDDQNRDSSSTRIAAVSIAVTYFRIHWLSMACTVQCAEKQTVGIMILPLKSVHLNALIMRSFSTATSQFYSGFIDTLHPLSDGVFQIAFIHLPTCKNPHRLSIGALSQQFPTEMVLKQAEVIANQLAV